jgi:hypothetical protein
MRKLNDLSGFLRVGRHGHPRFDVAQSEASGGGESRNS